MGTEVKKKHTAGGYDAWINIRIVDISLFRIGDFFLYSFKRVYRLTLECSFWTRVEHNAQKPIERKTYGPREALWNLMK